MMGVVSADGGSLSDTSCWNTARDSMTVIWRDTFSPDSTGRKYPSTASSVIRAEGTNRLVR